LSEVCFGNTCPKQSSEEINTKKKTKNDIFIFVSGEKSSNGKVLYEHSKKINPNTYFVTEADEVTTLQLDLTKKIGICGATSTPRWLMETIAEKLNELTLNAKIKE